MPQTKYLTVKEVAKQLEMSAYFVYEEVRGGKLFAYRFGRTIKIPPESVEKYIKSKAVTPPLPPVEIPKEPRRKSLKGAIIPPVKYIPGKTYFDLDGNVRYRD